MEGLIEEPGRAAWEAKDPGNVARESYEQETADFSDELRALLDADFDTAAWYDDQPPRR